MEVPQALEINTISSFIETLGVAVFAISGAFSAMQKRFDIFGIMIIGFVTALGGGTLRDVLMGYVPVFWMRLPMYPMLVFVACILTLLLKNYFRNLKITFVIFDAIGLGLYTMLGIQKGITYHLDPSSCIILGIITGSFGGVLRDVLLNEVPHVFRREVYATACVVGGVFYFAASHFIGHEVSRIITILLVCGIRLVAVKYNWSIPKFYT